VWGGHYHWHFHHSSVANSTMVEAELCVDNMELDLGTVNVQGGMNQLLTQQGRKRKNPPEQMEQVETSNKCSIEHHIVAFLCGFVCTKCNTGVGYSLFGSLTEYSDCQGSDNCPKSIT
jgi:hypothetical protein